jgi:predicted DNA repair protein MutK
MFLVGGAILVHGIPVANDVIHHAGEAVKSMPLGNILEQVVLYELSLLCITNRTGLCSATLHQINKTEYVYYSAYPTPLTNIFPLSRHGGQK